LRKNYMQYYNKFILNVKVKDQY